MALKSLELFTGAGGLALGVAKAGFSHSAVIEWNRDACASLRANSARLPLMSDWPVFEQDVRDYDFRQHLGRISLIAAGAPCQPFSLGGKHRGYSDERNMFPEVFRAVRESLPPVVIIENVKGLLRTSFRPYFEYILLALGSPDVAARKNEDWTEHKKRLERSKNASYKVTYQLLNAANFGVPQRRERVFIIAFRADLGTEWKPLEPTHSEEALLRAQWVDGSYWEEHGLKQPPIPTQLLSRITRLQELPWTKRWRTVRDALAGLPAPIDQMPHPTIKNHIGNPGARTYLGHTGSPLDEPAKTLKAGDHGVPGGENIVRFEDGSVRYFTVREAARLQTFPDDYEFSGAWCEGFRQLGNAVPVDLACAVATRIRQLLATINQRAVA